MSRQLAPLSLGTKRSSWQTLMRGKSSKVGKGRGVVVILRTTVDAALNLYGTES